ncbi:uncharacterized protein LOC143332524 [Chaetodon auriga]|uniref:uncharacterized protein LOC143332524 n=1 Tax=Chaetodon auriga TaxID=39042 RepID=UPI004032FEC3
MDLRTPFHDPSSQLQLLADAESIHTTAVESFSAATTSPPPVVTESSPVTATTFKTTTSIMTTDTTSSSSTSATTAATFTTSPANISELYFEVKVNVSRTGDGDAEQVLCTWLNSSLPDDMMMVLDLQLLSKAQRPNLEANLSTSEPVFAYRVSRERCVFQVQVMSPLSDTQEMEEQIRYLLLAPYSNGSISIAAEDVQINRILIFNCKAETHQTRKGLFEWPATSGGRNATWLCPKNPTRYATRHW